MNQRFLEVLATVLEMEPSEIHDDLTPETARSWDSFAHVMLVVNLEAAFGVRFSPAEATGIRSVAAIRAALRKHGAEV